MKVTGNSMHPTLESGAFVLIWHSNYLYKQQQLIGKVPYLGQLILNTLTLKVGHIVAVNHPKYGQIIKRIVQIQVQSEEPITTNSLNKNQHGVSPYDSHSSHSVRIKLRGDNQDDSVSVDALGWVESKDIIGKVIFKVSPKSH